MKWLLVGGLSYVAFSVLWLWWRLKAGCKQCNGYDPEAQASITFFDTKGRQHFHNWQPGDGIPDHELFV